MIAVTAALPGGAVRASVVLVHGSANSAVVWTFWQRALARHGCASYAIDLRGHGGSDHVDLSSTSMQDYADDVVSACGELAQKPVLMGWSMGGLVAMMAASRCHARAVVGLAPSTPATKRGPGVPLRHGVFGPEEYAITSDDPSDQPAMPDLDIEERIVALAASSEESRYARDERAAGIVVESLPCPLLIVTSTADTQWPRSCYEGLHLPATQTHLSVEGASHWGLVLNRRTLASLVPDVVGWIESLAEE